MIATRNDLLIAKAQLDNVDQLNAALAFLGKTSGSITVAPAPGISIVFDVANLLAYLTSLRDSTVLNLANTYGVTVSG